MATENYNSREMKKLLAIFALMVPASGLVHANEAPEPTTTTSTFSLAMAVSPHHFFVGAMCGM